MISFRGGEGGGGRKKKGRKGIRENEAYVSTYLPTYRLVLHKLTNFVTGPCPLSCRTMTKTGYYETYSRINDEDDESMKMKTKFHEKFGIYSKIYAGRYIRGLVRKVKEGVRE